MNKAKEKWLKGFQETLIELSEDSYVPMTVFFMADDDLALWFGEAIKSEQFIQYTLSDEPFVVSFINGSSLSSYVDFQEGVAKARFWELNRIFFNSII